jgi:N-acyl-D-amino-acid deacylase
VTSASARKFGIRKRGEIKEGYFADLVQFDYKTICDNGYKPPAGIDSVYINGTPVFQKNSIDRKRLAGRVLRKND